jgi:hypothetical protein
MLKLSLPEEKQYVFNKPVLSGFVGGMSLNLDTAYLVEEKHISQKKCYVIKLSSHFGEQYFVVHFFAISDPLAPKYVDLEEYVKSVIDGQFTVAEKLVKLQALVFEWMTTEQLQKLFNQVYKAGKASGKREIKKRFKQLMLD